MELNQDLVEKIISDLLAKAHDAKLIDSTPSSGCAQPAYEVTDGVFPYMEDAIAAAAVAWQEYLKCSLADRRKYIKGIRDFCSQEETLRYMAEQTTQETGMGNPEDKYWKNYYAATSTPGVEDLITTAWSGDDGLTILEYSPFGVIGAICPTTNPTETIINNSISMLAAGNSVVFSPHPRAKNISLWLIKKLNQTLDALGAPKNLIVTVKRPTIHNTNKMINHKAISMLVATGGPAIVSTVLASGKKAIGAGAGNPPVVVDQTADLAKAAKDIVLGASFDNNLPCTSEKECIAVDAICDLLIFHMRKSGAYQLSTHAEIEKLLNLVVDPETHKPRTEWIGKSALSILAEIGITDAPRDTKLIICEVSKMHPFVQEELMMPILPIVRVSDVDEAIEFACEVEHGNRHTAVMHSTDVHALTKMGKLIQTTIFVKNGPSFNGLGIGGEGYITFTIAGPTGEGLTSAKSFARNRRCVLSGDLNIR